MKGPCSLIWRLRIELRAVVRKRHRGCGCFGLMCGRHRRHACLRVFAFFWALASVILLAHGVDRRGPDRPCLYDVAHRTGQEFHLAYRARSRGSVPSSGLSPYQLSPRIAAITPTWGFMLVVTASLARGLGQQQSAVQILPCTLPHRPHHAAVVACTMRTSKCVSRESRNRSRGAPCLNNSPRHLSGRLCADCKAAVMRLRDEDGALPL